MTEKIIGYILLAVGLMIIISAAVSVFSVLTRQKNPIEFIKPTAEATVTPKTQEIEGVQVQMPSLTDITGMSSLDLVYITNLTIHLFLMGFIVNVGFKIASLGTQLVRPIVVKLREKEAQ